MLPGLVGRLLGRGSRIVREDAQRILRELAGRGLVGTAEAERIWAAVESGIAAAENALGEDAALVAPAPGPIVERLAGLEERLARLEAAMAARTSGSGDPREDAG